MSFEISKIDLYRDCFTGEVRFRRINTNLEIQIETDEEKRGEDYRKMNFDWWVLFLSFPTGNRNYLTPEKP